MTIIKRIAILAALAGMLNTNAQVLNPSSLLRLKAAKSLGYKNGLRYPQILISRGEAEEEPPYQPLMIEVDGEATVHQLEELGVVVQGCRQNILLACVPVEKLQEVLTLPGVISAGASGDMSSSLDKARPMSRVDAVQTGAPPLPRDYDGTGVVVGFADIGFDARHIAFDGRISAIYNYDEYYAECQKATTPEEIAAWTTDDPDNFHATHVGNILGGNYRGNDYYGVATGAEMVATTSRLTDVGFLSGVEDIIAYAKTRNKRAVVNISLANFLGPHDGTDLLCRYLSACAEDAVICISAGNSAAVNGYASQTLDDSDKIYRVVTNSLLTWDGFKVQGMTELWSNSSESFDFRIEVYDYDTQQIVYASEWLNHGTTSIEITDDDPLWRKYMQGAVYVQCGEAMSNGRYMVAVLYDTTTSEAALSSDGRWSRYYTSLAFRSANTDGNPVFVDIFADSSISFLGYADRASRPRYSHDGSINDMCTAPGVISVGNCSSRNTAPSIYGEELHWNFEIGEMCYASSYSTSPTMPRRPHFSAPGNYVVSAMSGQYLEQHDDWNAYLSAEANTPAGTYYWAAMTGTSMSAPMSAGIIALWLQADPTLTVEEIIEIAKSTARRDFADINDPQWGAGCIDAEAGLRRITSALQPVIKGPGEESHAYSLQGIKMGSGKRHELIESLPTGIYIIDGEKVCVRR